MNKSKSNESPPEKEKKKDGGSMARRILTAVIALPLLALYFYFLSDTPGMPLIVAAAGCITSYELMKCVGYHKMPAVAVPTYIFAAAVPFCARRPDEQYIFLGLFFFISFIYMFYMLAVAVMSKVAFKVEDIAVLYMMETYMVFGYTSIILIRDMEHGVFIYLLPFITAWMTDAGGYFIGRVFGKHKLVEHISPKKTVEGAIGGIIFCVVTMLIYALGVGLIFKVTPNYIFAAVLGAVIAVVSQFGDLIASLVKRRYGIKDYGNLIPGHGGMMDRCDSLIATAPFIYLICALAVLLPNFFHISPSFFLFS